MSKVKATQKNPQMSIAKSNLMDYFEEGQLVEWLSEHGKNILYGLAALFGLIILVYAVSSSQTSKAEQEYIQAANDFAYFSKVSQNPTSAKEALARLQVILSKHSELHATYDGGIAQTLLNRSETDSALPYANQSLKRVKSNNLPFYNEYAENSLLISQKDFHKAMENTLALQLKMKEAIENQANEDAFGDSLFALNLLRVAMLQQEQGDKTGELQTWQEWKQYAGLSQNRSYDSKISPQAFRSLIQQMAIGSFTLLDYISHRENVLRNPE